MLHRSDFALFVCWFLLMALTFMSFETTAAWLNSPSLLIAVVFAIALLKIRIVILHFMEVRLAPLPLRMAIEIWIVVLGATLLGLWLAPEG